MTTPAVYYSLAPPTLSESELHHLFVKRPEVGEEIDVVDGNGLRAKCIWNGSELELKELIQETRVLPKITLVLALIKGSRFDYAIEAAVELGVDEIIPWQSNRSIVKWGANWDAKHGDSKKSAKELSKLCDATISASKQCRRAFFPKVSNVLTTKQLIRELSNRRDVALGGSPESSLNIAILHESASERLISIQQKLKQQAGEIVVIIGPEGGIDDAELNAFCELSGKPYLLTDTVLRTATAVSAALAILR